VVSHGGVSRALRGLVLKLQGADIPLLEVPQDKVLLIRDGTASWF
jgi:broad specificity phosphatase PhoE